jgi:hypothetical protein
MMRNAKVSDIFAGVLFLAIWVVFVYAVAATKAVTL